MRHRLTISAIVALAVLTNLAVAQQPKLDAPKKAEAKSPAPRDSMDAVIAVALISDPDVKMAQAKIQLAEAELAKARLAVTQKVWGLRGKIDQAKSDVNAAQERLIHAEQRARTGIAPQSEVFGARDKLEAAKGALAAVEAEWKLMTSVLADPGATTGERNTPWEMLRTNRTLLAEFATRGAAPIQGPIPDRIRAALDKPVKLGTKGEKVTFEKALQVFKNEAELDVPVRGKLPMWNITPKNGVETEYVTIVSEGETLPVGAWFQVFQDASQANGGGKFYVREYGLLIANGNAVPSDAPTLTEFWRQGPARPESKPK